MSSEDAAARGAQAAWDAAALVRALLAGNDSQVKAVVERPGLDGFLAMYRLADLTARLLRADASTRELVAADPEYLLAGWERELGPEPPERVPRDLRPPGPQLRSDVVRDAMALVKAADCNDDDAEYAVLSSADPVMLPLLLARMCADFAHQAHGTLDAALAGWCDVAQQLDLGE